MAAGMAGLLGLGGRLDKGFLPIPPSCAGMAPAPATDQGKQGATALC
jgi:hypothetical protein